MSTQLANILKSFSKLSVGSLQQTLKHFNPKDEAIILSAEQPELTSMVKSVICTQTYSFMEDMEKFTEIFASGFGCPKADVLKKLEINGLYNSLEKLSQEDLTQVFKLLSLQETSEQDLPRQEMIGKIEEECFLQGVNKLLIKMCEGGSEVLKSYCKDLKMNYIENDDSKNAEEVMKSMFDLESDLVNDEDAQEEEEAAPAPSKKPAAKEKPAKKSAGAKKPAAPKKAPNKKPAAAKPAAAVESEVEESEEEAPAPATAKSKPPAKAKSKPPAAAASKSNGKTTAPAAAATTESTEVSGKRARKPVTKYEDEATSNGSTTTTTTSTTNSKAKAKPAATSNKRKAKEEDETDEEDDDEDEQSSSNGSGASGKLNSFGGYRDKDGKYISPPVSKIVKGVTKDQLHDFFNLEPLQEFCKMNDITYSSYKKSQLTKVIADFLETGERPLSKKEKLAKKAALKKQKTSKSSKSTNTKTSAAAAAAASSTTSTSPSTTTTPAAASTTTTTTTTAEP
ncbi:hypothetical protein PPL_10601 [Heterostelium album PN500]|uniref:Uncharacterized protein n=1 Tax=Heterostelium pallidum (strain ATCC 26659 / Pp 5 / PN500) TaxID=670386 RepID=D3BRJ0_HETP5|nr:hypothetical protein PPL_10601 [Heterostelium album PN500]EFA76022.1 hypothetical protein PPL_10601 [Heterostelium album PN500]|eukprot:XP_020428156.1 hypothetical protein PPL_10601 [Heterostelium album PN500]